MTAQQSAPQRCALFGSKALERLPTVPRVTPEVPRGCQCMWLGVRLLERLLCYAGLPGAVEAGEAPDARGAGPAPLHRGPEAARNSPQPDLLSSLAGPVPVRWRRTCVLVSGNQGAMHPILG